MKKVLIISELAAGGVERVNRLLAKGLRDKYEVYFLSIKGIGKEFVSDLDYIALDAESGKKAIFKIIKIMRKIKPDFIFTCSHTDTACSVIYSKLIHRKCKSIFTVHSIYSSMFQYKKKLRLMTQHYIPKWLGLYKKCDAVVYVSKGVGDDFRKIYGLRKEKEYIIYNPVFEYLPSQKKDPGNWHNPLRLVTAGRIEEEKRQDILIKTIKTLKSRGLDSELHIYGEGSKKHDLEICAEKERVSEKIFFEGFSNEILSKFRDYDIFLLSSEFESFGNVVVEAMGVGIPIIVFNCPVGPREILKHGSYGNLVMTNSPDCFADAVIRLLSDQDIKKKVEAARKESENYQLSHVIRNYIDMMEHVNS